MKRFFGFLFKGILFCGGVVGCIWLYLYCTGYFDPVPLVGYVRQPGAEVYLNESSLEAAVIAQGLRFSTLEGEGAVQQLLNEGASILIVAQTDTQNSKAIALAAEDAGAALFFVGQCPPSTALSMGDNVWYLGSEAAHGAELLGKQVALNFREGGIADANGDHLLQYYAYSTANGFDTVFNHYALDECEHYGVYSSLVTYFDDEGASLAFDAEQLAGQPQPEFILCSNEQDARKAHETALSLGWLDGETPVRIAAAANTPDAAKSLVSDGVALAAVYYEPDTVSDALAAFLPNVLERQFVALGSSLVPDAEGRFILPYKIAQ